MPGPGNAPAVQAPQPAPMRAVVEVGRASWLADLGLLAALVLTASYTKLAGGPGCDEAASGVLVCGVEATIPAASLLAGGVALACAVLLTWRAVRRMWWSPG